MTVVILRDTGVITVDHAEPLPITFVRTVDQLLDTLGVRPHEPQQRDQHDRDDGSD